METVVYTKFREKLAGYLDKVNADHIPLLVTRQNGDPVVVLSLKDFKSYEATFYLMASRTNAARLDQAIQELRNGEGEEKTRNCSGGVIKNALHQNGGNQHKN
jgi:antitoxin YefM